MVIMRKRLLSQVLSLLLFTLIQNAPFSQAAAYSEASHCHATLDGPVPQCHTEKDYLITLPHLHIEGFDMAHCT
jgi:hypothetical protein